MWRENWILIALKWSAVAQNEGAFPDTFSVVTIILQRSVMQKSNPDITESMEHFQSKRYR